MHFVHATRALDDGEESRLKALLDYGEPAARNRTASTFLVVPRLGTISPWASKATDIAHNTGLAAVHRIERGTIYTLELKRGLFRGKGLDAATRGSHRGPCCTTG